MRGVKRRTVGALVLFAVATALTACAGSGGDETTFDTWDEFAERDTVRSRQLVFIGIDGASWEYVDVLIQRGLLPNIARLRREGTSATLRSLQCPVSPPAWTTMLTGYLPEQSGVYSFGAFDQETKAFTGIRSTDARVPFVWEAAGRAGRRSAVVNVPMTYPVYPINGIMVSGLLTPIDLGGALPLRPSTRSDVDEVVRRAKRKAGFAAEGTVGVRVGEDELNLVVALLHEGAGGSSMVSLHLFFKDREGTISGEPEYSTFPANEYSPWMRVRSRVGDELVMSYARIRLDDEAPAGIAMSQTVFPIEAPFASPPSLADELTDRFGFYLPTKMMSGDIVPTLAKDNAGYASFFYDYGDWDLFCFVFTQTDNIHHRAGFDARAESVYVAIDRFLGDISQRMPPDAVLVVASDHGFTNYDRGIDLNSVLERMNLLERDGRRIDHEHTLVFHNLWHLYFNHENISRDALAASGYDVPDNVEAEDFLRDLMVSAFAGIEEDGRRYPVVVEPLPNGDGGAPDMRVRGTYDGYIVEHWALQRPRPTITFELTGTHRAWHAIDGVLLLWGRDIRPGVDAGVVGIENVAPTILYCLGLPVSPDMDGHVLVAAIDAAALEDRPVLTVTGYRNIERANLPMAAEREELEEKLRSLGYIQ
jgi:predicted AlkP superfamily phosphohydrolase/phosphomutase